VFEHAGGEKLEHQAAQVFTVLDCVFVLLPSDLAMFL
jgi:hypothetical protein